MNNIPIKNAETPGDSPGVFAQLVKFSKNVIVGVRFSL